MLLFPGNVRLFARVMACLIRLHPSGGMKRALLAIVFAIVALIGASFASSPALAQGTDGGAAEGGATATRDAAPAIPAVRDGGLPVPPPAPRLLTGDAGAPRGDGGAVAEG